MSSSGTAAVLRSSKVRGGRNYGQHVGVTDDLHDFPRLLSTLRSFRRSPPGLFVDSTGNMVLENVERTCEVRAVDHDRSFQPSGARERRIKAVDAIGSANHDNTSSLISDSIAQVCQDVVDERRPKSRLRSDNVARFGMASISSRNTIQGACAAACANTARSARMTSFR